MMYEKVLILIDDVKLELKIWYYNKLRKQFEKYGVIITRNIPLILYWRICMTQLRKYGHT